MSEDLAYKNTVESITGVISKTISTQVAISSLYPLNSRLFDFFPLEFECGGLMSCDLSITLFGWIGHVGCIQCFI